MTDNAVLQLSNPKIPSTAHTYSTLMNIKLEKDPLECGIESAAVTQNAFFAREPGKSLTWKQARFIEFMSSHILQFSLPLQNEFLEGVMGLYLEIDKRNR